MQNLKESGFTVIEVCIVLVVCFAAGFFAYTQWRYFELVERNTERKQAVNAMHFYLQEVYFPENESYPPVLNPEAIQTISQNELRDPSERLVTDYRSSLRYEPGNCSAGNCQRYTLRADLEQAEDFIRRSDPAGGSADASSVDRF